MGNILKGLAELINENNNIEQAINNSQVINSFNSIEDLEGSNSDQFGTKIGCAGNLWRNSGYEHRLIQEDFCKKYKDSTYEYGIPQGENLNNMIFADLATKKTSELYEIKYIVQFPIAELQVLNYITQCDLNCPKYKPWKLGERTYAKIFFRKAKKTNNFKKYPDIISFRAMPGVILYFDNNSEKVVQPDYEWKPEHLPSPEVIEEFKKQVKRQYGPIIPNSFPASKPIIIPDKKPEYKLDDKIFFDTDLLWEQLKSIGLIILLVIFIVGAIASAPVTTFAAFVALLISYGLSEE
jgi:hypothetical protein